MSHASRRVRLLVVLLVVLLTAATLVLTTRGSSEIQVTHSFVAGTPEDGSPVRLDTSLYRPDTGPAPAVLLTQGFGGDKRSLDSNARVLADRGYVVLTYSARGFGRSGGKVHFASPDYEIRDGRRLLDYLADLSAVRKVEGKPQLAVAGSSYGGGISLLLAAADTRVQAVAADITWNSLRHSLFPNFGGTGPGVYKKLWTGALFSNAFPQNTNRLQPGVNRGAGRVPATSTAVRCGRLAEDVCAAYQASAAAGAPTPAMSRLMAQASPASVLDRIKAPTLLSQGEQDSLFPLSEADANARGLASHGTPVRVVWRQGGHDAGAAGGSAVASSAADWFGDVFAGDVSAKQPFRFAEEAGVVSAQSGEATSQTREAPSYPGLAGAGRPSATVQLRGPGQPIAGPAGGSPAVITSIPGLGGLSGQADRLAPRLSSVAPGQTAVFYSDPLEKTVRVVGSASTRLRITSHTNEAQLFVGLRDVAPDGRSSLPSQLVNPVRITGLTPGKPKDVTVRLPSIVREVRNGHRLALTVSATDFAYAAPNQARVYQIGLPDDSAAVTIPTGSGTVIDAGRPYAWLLVGGGLCVLVAAAVALTMRRRRSVLKQRPDLADVPISIQSLTKEYAGGYRAVDDVSFTVPRGQVVGLLGPNGAGKTTTLRVLVGLITPTSGELHVFGEPVHPGAPVLARLGVLIEGPGFLPHLTGRENLRLFWAATGRPPEEAELDVALDIAGLGGSVDRRVQTYSQGMKQRLGIAQAMLGLPEVLILDEPTNGLDPPQIAEMREMLRDYARTGRTVVVSSHLLAEVEQTCTDVIVMHNGRLVAAGSVEEITGVTAEVVPVRRALEDVFLGLIGEDAASGRAAGKGDHDE
ncbi:alpha/beta fold hydrolase [Demetria terragena]|uniref:alpha/beta fold hydrolase n=1 Tax=Demetria terragena TaxID=63959 RepID=UPI0003682F79|nr:alpha/beta fold hydrolase [Demetria terragena]